MSQALGGDAHTPQSPGPAGGSGLGGPQAPRIRRDQSPRHAAPPFHVSHLPSTWQTPQGQSHVSIAVPTTAEEYESEDSEEEDEHPLSRNELQVMAANLHNGPLMTG